MSNIKLWGSEQGLSMPVNDMATQVKDAVYSGDIDAVEVGIALKKMAKLSEDLFKDEQFKEVIHTETKKSFEGKTCEKYGAVISERATRTWYDFAACGDLRWDALNAIQGEIKELIEQREKELKAMIPDEKIKLGISNNNKTEVITELPELVWRDAGGQVIEIKPPIKYQSTGLVYSKL